MKFMVAGNLVKRCVSAQAGRGAAGAPLQATVPYYSTICSATACRAVVLVVSDEYCTPITHALVLQHYTGGATLRNYGKAIV